MTGLSRRRRFRLTALATAGAAFAALVALSCALFVWPGGARPRRVGAVLSLDGTYEQLREQTAVDLVRDGYAPVLLFSVGYYPNVACPSVPRVKVVCFKPVPGRTIGEVEFAVRFARRHHVRSIMVVAGHAQTTRARLLVHRCFSGRSVVVPAPAPPAYAMPYQVVYEWGALLKALVIDPGC